MCRHLAYVGPEVSLFDLLIAPRYSLVEQARAPRHQRDDVATVNPDGFGIGWYDDRGVAHRDREARPIWEDTTLEDRIRPLRSGAVLAAVRLASPGSAVEVASNAPLLAQPWLFSLNGFVKGYHRGVGDDLRSRITPRRATDIEGSADTGVLFALVLDRLDAGATPGAALRDVVTEVQHIGTGRLNLLVTDGHRIAATASGNSLFVRERDGVIVASEPLDDDPLWERVPENSLVVADAHGIAVEAL